MQKYSKRLFSFINNKSLQENDPTLFKLISSEYNRQRDCINLIASENYANFYISQTLGSCTTNKYSEGYPGRRYYAGNQYIDQIEVLCQQRLLNAFKLDSTKWGANVQALSGCNMNFLTYTALLQPGDKILGLDLPSGGHLSHGYQTETKKVSKVSKYFTTLGYKIDESTHLIDYDQLAQTAKDFQPKLIVAGGSAYPRDWDYKRMRQIADECGAYLLADISHFSALVLSQIMNSPFEYADVVTSTTHKILRGPRAGFILARQERMDAINDAVFPGMLGGPHNHTIAALAAQLHECQKPEFHQYCHQVYSNAQSLSKSLMSKDFKLITNGTDCHLVLVDLRPHGVSGAKFEKICDLAHITFNRNSIIGEKSPLNPSGVRLGTPAITARGMKEKDMQFVSDQLEILLGISKQIIEKKGKKLKDFEDEINGNQYVESIQKEVIDYLKSFDFPKSVM